VNCILFSSDGEKIIVGLKTGTVYLWDISTEEFIWKKNLGERLLSIASYNDKIAIGTENFLIHILSIENGKELFSIKTNIDDISVNYPNFIVFSPDGTLLAVATSEKILILKLANDNAELSRKIESTTDNIFTCLAFSPDGTKLVSGSIENKVRVWNVENGSMVATMVGHTMAITGVAFLSNGEKVVSASSDGTIRVWSINGTLALDITTLKSRVSSFAVSPDGQYLLSSSQDGKIIIFRSIDGTVLGQITGHTTFVRSVLFLPDDSMLISSSWDKSISVWKIVEGTKSKSLEGHSGEVQSLAISPDGKTIASAGWDDQIIIWDLQNMKMVNKIKYNFGNVLSIKYTPDGQSIIVCSDDGTVTKWNISGTSFVNIIRLSKVISTRLFIYGIELNYTQALEQNFENPYNIADMLLPSKSDQFAWDSTILQNSNKIAIGTTGGEIKILDLENSQIVKSIKSDLKEIRAIASSKDDRMITIGGFDGSVQSFDTNSGEIIWSVPDSYKQVRSLTYSPDGQLIAAAFSDGMIKIIDASNGKLLTTLYGHTNWVNAVAFSSDGRLLASASDDGTIIIWGIIDVEKTNSEKTTYSIDQNTSEITPSSTQSESTTNISTSLTRTFEMNNRPQERDLISLDNLNNIVILAKLSNKHARQITFSPDGKLLAIALSAGGEIIQVENQIQVATLNNSLSPTRITFSNNGDLIATASNHTIDVSNTSTWEKMKTLNVNINTVSKGEINALAFSSTGKYLAAALSDKVPIWEVSTFDMMNPIDGNCIYLDNILFYDRDQYLLSGYCSYIRLSNISSGSLLRQRKIEDWLTSLALSPVNDFFVSGSRNGTITLWSLPDITKKKEEYFSSKIINLTFSHDGSFIIAGIDDKVAFLSVNDAKLLNNFAFTSKVVTIAISPLGDLIAAGTEDGNIYLLGVNK
jgi:WD40 repeat protein